MADILYVKTSDGVILRFGDSSSLAAWVSSGRISVTGRTMWLDANQEWRPVEVLLERLGIPIPSKDEDVSAASSAFPGINDEYFNKAFGPAASQPESHDKSWGTARKPVITGRYGAVGEIEEEGGHTIVITAEMAAFDGPADSSHNQIEDTRISSDTDPVVSVDEQVEDFRGTVEIDESEADAGLEIDVPEDNVIPDSEPVTPIGPPRMKSDRPVRQLDAAADAQMYRAAGGGGRGPAVWMAILVVVIAAVIGFFVWDRIQESSSYNRVPRGIVKTDTSLTPAASRADSVQKKTVNKDIGKPAPEVDSSAETVEPATADAGDSAEIDEKMVPDQKLVDSEPVEKAEPVPAPAVKPAPALKPVPAVARKSRPEPLQKVKKISAPESEPKSAPKKKAKRVREPSVAKTVSSRDYRGHIKAGNRALATDPEQAQVHYEVANSLKPGNCMILTKLGDASRAMRRLDSATDYYEQALRSNSNYNPAVIGLARIFKTRGQTDKAQKYYKMYLEINGSASGASEARQFLGNQ